jgi:cytoskeletal protein CcmA (bactofilin family)
VRSFFQREQEPAPKAPAPSPAPPPAAQKASRGGGRESTRIARGSTVVGEISGTAELVIEGRVEGQIELDNRVVVGARGEVEGRIVGAAVEVAGKVVGNVFGKDRVQVLESGRLEGDVTSPRVVIAEGAFFKGKVEMSSGSAAKTAPKPDRTPPGPARSQPIRPPGPSPDGPAAGPTDSPAKANP